MHIENTIYGEDDQDLLQICPFMTKNDSILGNIHDNFQYLTLTFEPEMTLTNIKLFQKAMLMVHIIYGKYD